MKNTSKVILAEDNRLQRVIFTRLLEGLGYIVLPAEDGQEALDLVGATDAQIVLSDFQMPKLNGIELTQKIRSLDLDHYVHIIMITGLEESDIRAEALEAGVDDFITKGQSHIHLQARMRSASRLVQHAAALAEANQTLRETHERIKEDLRAAANAQRQLLPDIHREMVGYRISSTFVPSAIVSGDMFGCFPLTADKLGFYTVDVSGHGVHASLLSVAIGHLITPEFFRTMALQDMDHPDLAALVDNLNQRFSQSENDDYFTMFCGIADKNTGQIDYCQAAYPSPQHISKSGAVNSFGDGGFPVGMLPQAKYENGSYKINRGDALVVYSDALIEAENHDNVPFGDCRIQDIVSKCQGADKSGLPDALAAALDEWRGGLALEDDLTIVTLERT